MKKYIKNLVIMKAKVIILMVVCFGLVGCYTVCHKHKIPKNLKPISRTEYNDVYTVYYNCNQNCSEFPNQYEGDTIKICGWRTKTDLFSISDDTIKMYPNVYIDNISLSDKDIKKKIYVTGIIYNRYSGGAPEYFLHIDAIDFFVE